MQIRTLWPFRRRCGLRDAMRFLVKPNRYQHWTDKSGTELGPLAPPPLSQEEVTLIERWGAAAREAYGTHVEVRQGPHGEPCLIAISGYEDTDVEWLVYRVALGFQSDEWCGASHWSPSLEHALSAIAPMPKSVDLVLC